MRSVNKGTGSVGPQSSGPRFAAKVQPLEWTKPPVLTALNQLHKILEEGKPLEANLIICKDDIKQEIQQIWNAYSLTNPMTIARVSQSTATGPDVSMWWDLAKARSHRPTRCKVDIWASLRYCGRSFTTKAPNCC